MIVLIVYFFINTNDEAINFGAGGTPHKHIRSTSLQPAPDLRSTVCIVQQIMTITGGQRTMAGRMSVNRSTSR